MPKNTQKIIDCDIHIAFNDTDLMPYLSNAWRAKLKETGPGRLGAGYTNPVGVNRRDAIPPGGGKPGSDPDHVVEQLILPYNIEYAILTGGIYNISSSHDADFSAALVSAYNDHVLDNWIGKHPSFKMAMNIATQDPLLAAQEIDRIGSHPGIVAVIMSSATSEPFGKRFYHPIYEAAERQGLPVMIHPGNEGAGSHNPPTAAGYPSYYIEWHTNLSQNFMAHLVSLVCEGVFVKYPNLKFVLVEGGVAWLPHLMWRLDKNYKALRSQVPWLTKLPSEYIREHCFLTTQPIEEPDNPRDLVTLFKMVEADNLLLYSSDYPHWDFDDPRRILTTMPNDMKQKIFYDNAKSLFAL